MATTKRPGAGGRRGDVGLEQVRALSHPLRLRLLELFAASPRTTKQAAVALGEAPTRLYHHVAALERAGLIRLRETRQNRGTTEKYFEAVSRRILPAESEGRAMLDRGRDELAALGIVAFDQARNELVQALTREPRESLDVLVAVRGLLNLTPAQAKRTARELQAVLTRGARSGARPRASKVSNTPNAPKRGAGRRRFALTLALIPLPPEPESV